MNNYYALVMAGGVGSRFWPVSTEKFPKQFHDMLGTGNSLIRQTFERINGLVPPKNIFVATNERYQDLVLEQLPELGKDQLLLEPSMRNTAPCILYTALKIYQINKNGVMLVAPSDHWIDDESGFIRSVETAYKAASENDILMTLGIQPNTPSTGYGYIQYEKSNTEKPDLETAEKFLKNGDYLWNAGIFVWSVKSIINAFEMYLPEMKALFDVANIYNTSNEKLFMKEHYKHAENISIDFGIMERAKNVHVLPVDFGWNDLGTWGSLYHKLEKDTHHNAVVGPDVLFRDAGGNMIKTQNGKKVVVQGLQDFIVVEKEDALLICPKNAEQDIKQIVSEVKNTFGDAYI